MLKKYKYKLLLYGMYLFVFMIFVVLPVTGYLFYRSHTYTSEFLQTSEFDYPGFSGGVCSSAKHPGQAGVFKEKTVRGFPYTVKTPANYQSDYAHPLIVVFAPATVPAPWVEKYTGLTSAATQAGYIIVYVGSRQMSIESILEFGTIPGLVADKWCVDSQKVFFTGHSDGGTVSSALTFLEESPVRPTAIVPSAAGMRGEDLAHHSCPAPVSVMVMHGKNDGLFSGFGKQAAQWWRQCNECLTEVPGVDEAGCIVYTDCLENTEVRYCEIDGNHFDWPRQNKKIIDFFNTSGEIKEAQGFKE